jgi:SAM-dependent methyltransferase
MTSKFVTRTEPGGGILRPMIIRPERASIDVATMRGLEIGPLAAPRIRKDEGPVRYLDHASAAELRQKYAVTQVIEHHLDDIVDVDYVIGKDRTISETVRQDGPFDYVMASHVIEHIPDPISWMDDLTHVLKPGGIVSLIIPDKRYSFDINRGLTEISDLVDAYLRRLRQPSFRQVYDFHSKAIASSVDAAAVWAGTADAALARRDDVDDPDAAALQFCRRMQESDDFVDVHCNVFTPDSFLALFEKLAHLALIQFEIAAFFPTDFNSLEFYVSLRLLDPVTDAALRLERQRASLALARADAFDDLGTDSADGATAVPHAAQIPVTMRVSQLERRALVLKREAMEWMRTTAKRLTHR